jgi:hypothetical protein
MKEIKVRLKHIYKRRYYIINHYKNKRSSFTDDQVHSNIIKKKTLFEYSIKEDSCFVSAVRSALKESPGSEISNKTRTFFIFTDWRRDWVELQETLAFAKVKLQSCRNIS